MPHAAARRRRAPGDEPRYRLLGPALLDEIGPLHFAVAADLADHDDALGLVVGAEHLTAIDEAGAVDRLAPLHAQVDSPSPTSFTCAPASTSSVREPVHTPNA